MCVHLCSLFVHGSSKWLNVTLGTDGSSISVEFCPSSPLSRCCSLIVNMCSIHSCVLLAVQTWVDHKLECICLL